MNKKAFEMATSTIIAIVLGLIVLIILAIFIQSQVSKGGQKIGTLEGEIDYAPDKCQSMIKGTFCSSAPCAGEYEDNPKPPGEWADCGKTITGKPYCCRKKSTTS